MAQEQEQSPQQIQEEANEVLHYHWCRTSSRKGISQDWSFLTIFYPISFHCDHSTIVEVLKNHSMFPAITEHVSNIHHIPSSILAPHPTRGRQQTYNSYNKMWTPTSLNSQHRCKRSRRRRENHLYLLWRSSSSSLQSWWIDDITSQQRPNATTHKHYLYLKSVIVSCY